MRISSKLEKQLEEYVVENKEKHYRIAYSYVKNTDDALDIVQESIFKALISLNTLKNPEFMKTWFYRILVNCSLDCIRKQKKIITLDNEVLYSYIDEVNDTYTDIDLHKALDELPDSYRSIIILRFFEDLKIEEIAEILNENINTIKTRLYKSLDKLRIKMND
ncbi:sigma-70 family RNA polymerase sigma factor [Sedimentibacter hydroxybenzoicus DSM 7310]|uniref:Sigma-70 family RNA polymerase sigma factor n=1 Tax=Sedimentibacter hydroxybenzoicus DSM 7310 TaxID=1123245 RepID=A0A974BL77_SEDHY|nr:RNA polymerase sigma factor [Sedimentibacter hydroxybenzoicus]NYB75117.1 sigma-70 family RNA polymerase sigma factor [Sedimentibacter hydroxybenzoicus DSM 7310]